MKGPRVITMIDSTKVTVGVRHGNSSRVVVGYALGNEALGIFNDISNVLGERDHD